MTDLLSPAYVCGRVRPHRVTADLWTPTGTFQHNAVLYDWAGIMGRLLTAADTRYRISGMYLEYKNVANPDLVIAAPGFDRSGSLDYYTSLATSPDVDFLRVPLDACTTRNDNPALFSADNVLRFLGRSQGLVGLHGKAFSDASNSKIYGGALVALVEAADYTQDVLFSRFYLDGNNQQAKLPTSQVGMEWELILQ